MIAPVQTALASAAVALMLVYAMLHLRNQRAAEVLLALMFATGAAYMATVWARMAGQRDLATILGVFAAPGPFFFLAATQVYFDDRVWGWRRLLAVAGAMWALDALTRTRIPLLNHGFDVAAGLLFLAALVMAARGWQGDLVAERRRDRAWFLATGGGLGVAITALSAVGSAWALPFAACGVLGLLLAYGARYLRVDAPGQPEPAPAPIQRPSDAGSEALAGRIRRAFEDDRLHRQEDLSLSRLARHLDAPEHHVRAAINRRLGARNFNAFVNGYRLAEVREALVDQSQAEVPITTIALDAGFASLPTFNRVFREAYGETPGALRQRARTSSPPT